MNSAAKAHSCGWIMSKHTSTIRCSACLLTLLLLQCAFEDDTTVEAEPVVVSLAVPGSDPIRAAGFLVALEKGYYQRERLRVTVRSASDSSRNFSELATGAVHFAVADADQLLMARSNGMPLKGVALIQRHHGAAIFAHRADILQGLRVGSAAGIRRAGVHPTQPAGGRSGSLLPATAPVELIRGEYAQLVPSLKQGELDVLIAFSWLEPVFSERYGGVHMITAADRGVDLYGDVLITTDRMIEEYSDIVAPFVRASLAGWSYAVENPEEASQLIAKHDDRFTAGELAAMLNAIRPLVRPDNQLAGWSEDEQWREVHSRLRTSGEITVPIHVNTAYTGRFVPARTRR